MDDEGEDDPFASLIIPNCQITSSQEEELLQISDFAGPTTDNNRSPRYDGSEESPATEIVILSLSDNDEDENFQTPSEHDDMPPTNTSGCVRQIREADEKGAVELGNDSDNFGLKGSLGMDGKLIEIRDQDEPGKFGGLENVPMACMENLKEDAAFNDTMVVEVDQIENQNSVLENVESGLVEGSVGLTDCLIENAQKVSDRMPVRDVEESVSVGEHKLVSGGKPVRKLKESDHIAKSRIEVENVGIMENVEATVEEIRVELTHGLMEKTLNVSDKVTRRAVEMSDCLGEHKRASFEKPERELEESDLVGKHDMMLENGNLGLACKRPEGTSNDVRRELPFSLRPQEKHVGEESTWVKKRALNDLLEGLKSVVGEVDGYEGVDIRETAKRRGLTFPRPRWRLSENFDV